MDTIVLRLNFKTYFANRYPNDNNPSATVSMAFYLERHGHELGINFQDVLANGSVPDYYKQRLEEYFTNRGRKNPRGDASTYEHSLRLLLEFIGQHPVPSAIQTMSTQAVRQHQAERSDVQSRPVTFVSERGMDICSVMESLRQKRPIFHSEADFQFALAWEIQLLFPDANVRLEYPWGTGREYVDIIVTLFENIIPIELKYLTKELHIERSGEAFNLKEQGAQDVSKYDCMKDICRLERFGKERAGFSEGYALWLSNDPSYVKAPLRSDAGYYDFSIHEGAKKCGTIAWGDRAGEETRKKREKQLVLQNSYSIHWNDYSNLETNNGLFRYALVRVT